MRNKFLMLATGLIFMTFIVNQSYSQSSCCSKYKQASCNTKTNNQSNNLKSIEMEKNLNTTSFVVAGKCNMCTERIEKAAKTVNGIKQAEYDLNSHTLAVRYESGTDLNVLYKKIAEAGHDVGDLKASDEAYNNLPSCCKYR